MASETIEFGGTTVKVTETDDGFEATEVTAKAAFADSLRDNDMVSKVNDGGDKYVRFSYDPTAGHGSGEPVYPPEEATVEMMERNRSFDSGLDGGVFVQVVFEDE